MGRYSGKNSYEFGIDRRGDDYRLWWTVDYYVQGSRGRFPRTFNRWTDRAGAERFAKKHKVPMPDDPAPGGNAAP
jgi:hypothetical protein